MLHMNNATGDKREKFQTNHGTKRKNFKKEKTSLLRALKESPFFMLNDKERKGNTQLDRNCMRWERFLGRNNMNTEILNT